MVQIEKIMILSVPESNGEIFDKILDVIRHSVISDVTEVKVNNESVIQVGELIIDSLQHTIHKGTQEISVTNAPQETKKETGFPPRKIAGTILLCMAFFVVMFFLVAGAGLGGLIFALPFLTCGILCFALKKNVGLWCAWDVYVLFDLYMSYATGISRSSVLHTFQWTYQMNYMRLAFAWFSVLSLAVMIAVTAVRFGKTPFASENKGRNRLIVSWLVLAVLQAIAMIWVHTGVYKYIVENIFEMEAAYRLITIALSWSRIIAFTVAMVVTIRFVKMKKAKATT